MARITSDTGIRREHAACAYALLEDRVEDNAYLGEMDLTARFHVAWSGYQRVDDWHETRAVWFTAHTDLASARAAVAAARAEVPRPEYVFDLDSGDRHEVTITVAFATDDAAWPADDL